MTNTPVHRLLSPSAPPPLACARPSLRLQQPLHACTHVTCVRHLPIHRSDVDPLPCGVCMYPAVYLKLGFKPQVREAFASPPCLRMYVCIHGLCMYVYIYGCVCTCRWCVRVHVSVDVGECTATCVDVGSHSYMRLARTPVPSRLPSTHTHTHTNTKTGQPPDPAGPQGHGARVPLSASPGRLPALPRPLPPLGQGPLVDACSSVRSP
jgi:hypothetical protein